jgi:hypothetical protein
MLLKEKVYNTNLPRLDFREEAIFFSRCGSGYTRVTVKT